MSRDTKVVLFITAFVLWMFTCVGATIFGPTLVNGLEKVQVSMAAGVEAANAEWSAEQATQDAVAPTPRPKATPIPSEMKAELAKFKLNVAQGEPADVVPTATATSTKAPEDLYKSQYRKAYYAEVDRWEAENTLPSVKGIEEVLQIGVTHQKPQVYRVGHANFTALNGSGFNVPWNGGENVVNVHNDEADTLVVAVAAYPVTGFTMSEYPTGVEPNLEIQALWPLANPGHCGKDNGCEVVRVWDASLGQNGLVLNSVREYTVDGEGNPVVEELVPADMDVILSSVAVAAPNPEPAALANASAPAPIATEAPAEATESCVPEDISFAAGYSDAKATSVVFMDPNRWIYVGMDPATINGVYHSEKVLAEIAPGIEVVVEGLGRDDKGNAYAYACAGERPNEAKKAAWLTRESNGGTREVEQVVFE